MPIVKYEHEYTRPIKTQQATLDINMAVVTCYAMDTDLPATTMKECDHYACTVRGVGGYCDHIHPTAWAHDSHFCRDYIYACGYGMTVEEINELDALGYWLHNKLKART